MLDLRHFERSDRYVFLPIGLGNGVAKRRELAGLDIGPKRVLERLRVHAEGGVERLEHFFASGERAEVVREMTMSFLSPIGDQVMDERPRLRVEDRILTRARR